MISFIAVSLRQMKCFDERQMTSTTTAERLIDAKTIRVTEPTYLEGLMYTKHDNYLTLPLSLSLSLSLVHTYVHTFTHPYTHTYAYTFMFTHTQLPSHYDSTVHTHIHSPCPYTLTYTYTLT